MLGSRGSPLALAQAEIVKRLLQGRDATLEISIKVIRTHGDEDYKDDLGTPVSGKALFTKRVEDALAAGQIDLAVHSVKDLPNSSAPQLTIAAIPPREDPRDALVSSRGADLAGLPADARIGTSSLRRSAQLKAARPDVRIQELQGNVGTRIRRMEEHGWDGVILAVAGLRRLGLEGRITQVLHPTVMTPAPGQGALAIQARRDDRRTLARLVPLNDPDARATVDAERSLSQQLGGDCNVPLGAYAAIQDGVLRLDACVADPDGTTVLRESGFGDASHPQAIARGVAQKLLDKGAQRILEAVAE